MAAHFFMSSFGSDNNMQLNLEPSGFNSCELETQVCSPEIDQTYPSSQLDQGKHFFPKEHDPNMFSNFGNQQQSGNMDGIQQTNHQEASNGSYKQIISLRAYDETSKRLQQLHYQQQQEQQHVQHNDNSNVVLTGFVSDTPTMELSITKQTERDHHPNDNNSMSQSKFELADTPKANVHIIDMFSGFKEDDPSTDHLDQTPQDQYTRLASSSQLQQYQYSLFARRTSNIEVTQKKLSDKSDSNFSFSNCFKLKGQRNSSLGSSHSLSMRINCDHIADENSPHHELLEDDDESDYEAENCFKKENHKTNTNFTFTSESICRPVSFTFQNIEDWQDETKEEAATCTNTPDFKPPQNISKRDDVQNTEYELPKPIFNVQLMGKKRTSIVKPLKSNCDDENGSEMKSHVNFNLSSCSRKLSVVHNLDQRNTSIITRKVISKCSHSDQPYYANGLCKNCYHKCGRNKKANCHPERTLYARGLCKACYLVRYRKIKKVKIIIQDI